MCSFSRIPAFLALLFLALPAPLWSEPPAAPRTDRYGDALPPGAVVRLGSVRLSHDNLPGVMAFTADHKTLAVLTVQDTVNRLWLWNVATGEKIRSVDFGTEPYMGAAFSHDGRWLVLYAGDFFALIETATGKVVHRLKPPQQGIPCLALSPDGKVLAISYARQRLDEACDVRLLEAASGKELGRLQGHKTDVETMVFSGDGQRLLSSSGERKGVAGSRFPETIPAAVCVWDVATRKLHRRMRPNGLSVVFAPDGKSMACYDTEKGIHLWDLERDREKATLEGVWHSYLFSPDSKTLIAGGLVETLTEWDAATGKKLRTFSGHAGKTVYPTAISADGKMLATVGYFTQWDTSVRLWDMASGKEHRPFEAHCDSVSCLAFAPDGKTLVSGSNDTTLRVWDAVTGESRRVYTKHGAAITAVAFSPDGKTMASGDQANLVHLWDPASGKQLRRLEVSADRSPERQTGIRCLAFADDGKTLIVGSMSAASLAAFQVQMRGLLAVWDTASGKEVQARKSEGSCPVALTEDGRYLASGLWAERTLFVSPDSLRLHRRGLNKILARIEGSERGTFEHVIFSADGKILATQLAEHHGGLGGGIETHAELWEVATGKRLSKLQREDCPLAFSPDGQFLAATNRGSSRIYLRSAVTGRYCGELPGQRGKVECGVFSPDGRRLATAGANQIILLWDVSRFQKDGTLPRIEATHQNVEKLLSELRGDNAGRAYRAVAVLARMPEQSLPLLREHLKPVAGMPAATLEQAVKHLDSDEFAVREQGRLTLEKAGELAQPALRRALAGQPSLELRRRAEELLGKVEVGSFSAEQVHSLRALAVLERIGNREAVQILRRLAEGAPAAFLTEEARASLRRLQRRRPN